MTTEAMRPSPRRRASRPCVRAACRRRRLRWSARPGRRRPRRRPGRAPRRARPERGRQDDPVQRHRRRHPPHRGNGARSTASTAPGRPRVCGRDSAWPAPTRRRACSLGLTVEDNLLPRLDRQARRPPLAATGAGYAATAGTTPPGRRRAVWLARSPRHGGRRPRPRPAAPARDRHGRRHRADADDARRTGVRALPRRARALDRTAARDARLQHHAAADRARHGRRPRASPSGWW